MDFRNQVQAIQRQEENKVCIDCNAHSPQWASVSFGTFFCLECSGQHRSLGVHISFVRSVTMDSWKEDQYKKMQLGGNRKAREFFQLYGIDGLPIKQKYHTKAADLYREKLNAEFQGVQFNLPTPTPDLAQPHMPTPKASTIDPAGQTTEKSKKEEFFERKASENSSRPSNLPPSQGGRYEGFGNSEYVPPPKQEGDLLNDAFSTFSKGFSLFATKATEYGKIAAEQATVLGSQINETVIKPTAQKIQDPNLRQNLSTTFTQIGSSLLEQTDRGITYLTSTVIGEEQRPSPSNHGEAAQMPTNQTVENSQKEEPKENGWQADEEEWANF